MLKIKFRGEALPEKILLEGKVKEVKSYIPKPNQCYSCLKSAISVVNVEIVYHDVINVDQPSMVPEEYGGSNQRNASNAEQNIIHAMRSVYIMHITLKLE